MVDSIQVGQEDISVRQKDVSTENVEKLIEVEVADAFLANGKNPNGYRYKKVVRRKSNRENNENLDRLASACMEAESRCGKKRAVQLIETDFGSKRMKISDLVAKTVINDLAVADVQPRLEPWVA